MNGKIKIAVIVLCFILMAAGVGCVALSSLITPAEIDKKAVEYVVEAGVAKPEEFGGYPNLAKAEKLKRGVDCAHTVNQFDLQQEMEQDVLEYSILSDVVLRNYKAGQQREEALFGETGLLSLSLSMAGVGTLAGFLGLMRKRPGDITQTEMEQTLAAATGKTTAELSEKQKQLVQVVKGVQAFFDTYKKKTPDELNGVTVSQAIADMKVLFDRAQDTSTQVAVATIKKENGLG